jgi:hypothetical protein
MKFHLVSLIQPCPSRLVRLWSLVACLLLCQLPLPAGAAEIAGLYEATVPVASRDDERQRQQAFSAAMRLMLVKLTGRTDTNANPVITRALAAPQPYVETFAYRSLTPQDSALATQAEQIGLQVTFFQSGIQRLLNEAGIPVWPQNRPETLVWLVIQDELGERFLAAPAPAAGGEVLASLQNVAAVRGVPLLLPLLDFEDQRALRAEQLWNFDQEALRRASARYQSDGILALRLFRSLSGDVIGKAVYLFRDRVLEFEALESPLGPFVDGSINIVAEELAAYYSILLSGIDNNTEVLLTVDGIRNLSDYAGLMQYVASLAPVNSVQLLSVEEGTVQLQLRTGGQFRQLIESIALDRRMSSVGEVSRLNQQVFMHYQWLAQAPVVP